MGLLGTSPLASEAADDDGDDDKSMSIILRLDPAVAGVDGRKEDLGVFRMDDGMGEEEPSILEGVEVAVAGLREAGARATIAETTGWQQQSFNQTGQRAQSERGSPCHLLPQIDASTTGFSWSMGRQHWTVLEG